MGKQVRECTVRAWKFSNLWNEVIDLLNSLSFCFFFLGDLKFLIQRSNSLQNIVL